MPRRKKNRGSVDARLELARKNNTSAALLGTALDSSNTVNSKNKPSPKDTSVRPQTPQEELLISEGCICHREAKTFVCIICKMFCFGRTYSTCPIHPNVTYLMDFSCCPYCSGPAEHLHIVNMEYERYFKT